MLDDGIRFKIDTEGKAMLQRAAEEAGVSLSELVRSAARAEAVAILAAADPGDADDAGGDGG